VRRVLRGRPLYALGNASLLSLPIVGVSGAREASPEGIAWARHIGSEAAFHGFAVATGYARGVDRAALAGALEAGGAGIAVLPEGMDHFAVVPELKHAVDLESNFLAISMFDVYDSWQTWRALERNALVVALSQVLFAVEPRERGGTRDAALKAARLGRPLYVVLPHAPLPRARTVNTADELRRALQWAAARRRSLL
jgi:predicted Rossmann fold nucleotide-binding protein DprA/Smf involved in DNA uptake